MVIAALSVPSNESKLEDEFDIEFELTLIAPSAPSTLAEEVERFTDDT